MHLQGISLNGFKSFADPSSLRFEPGVTAIVGPNGCGKSNIADAIRWVLGEQSAKALRGGKMQDVIFEGADTRKPSQLCEVSLHLTECEQQLGTDFHDVEITRRVHRDGQGEYYLNGQVCRLKDIQKLFMDTGIGRTSYSIMAQGQIDLILSSKPDDRRAVFEEAAGITRYKSQRREAMNKLELTNQNLARITDIVGEVSRQIGGLRRQAAKAMRYKRLNHRLRHLSLAWSCQQHRALTEALAVQEARVAGLRAAVAERRGHLEARQASLDEKKGLRGNLRQRAEESQRAVYDLRSQIEQAENGARMSEVKRTGLGERVESARQNVTETEMQLREVAAQVDTGAQDRQIQLNLLGSSDSIFQERTRELAVVDGRISKLEQDLQQAKFDLLQRESEVARLRTDCSGYEVDHKTSLHRQESLTKDLELIRTQHAGAQKVRDEFAGRVKTAAEEKARAQAGAADAQGALTEKTREFRDAQRRLQEIDRQLAQRTARLNLLKQLQERWEGFGEGAKAVLQGRLDASLAGAKARPVLQGLEVKPEFGRALEALLGTAAEAIEVADAATAHRVLAQLEREQIGSAILRLAEVSGRGHGADGLPAGLVPAISALENPDPSHPAVALLESCYLADDLENFLRFWKENPGFEFLSVATRKGEVVDRRGLVSGGHFSSKRQSSSLVQREIELRETGRAVVAEQKQHDEQRVQIDALSAQLAAAEQALERAREEVLAATQTLAAVQAEERSALRAAEEIGGRKQRMENEMTAAGKASQEAQARFAKAQEGLAKSEAGVMAAREKIQGLDTVVASERSDRDAKRDHLAQARLELAERRQKVEVLDRGLTEMERRRGELGELLVLRQHEIESWTEQMASLEKESAGLGERGRQLSQTLAVAQQQVETVRTELITLEREIDGLETAQASERRESDAALAELGSDEVKLAEGRQKAQFLAEDVAREFSADIAAENWRLLLWKADDEPEGAKPLDLDEEAEGEGDKPAEGAPKPRPRKIKARGEPTEADLAALDSTDWAAVKVEADALRQRVAGLGAVNLIAIEEYVELKQRHDFLTTQSNDLIKARTELLQAIEEINRTSQQQFTLTFEQIRKNFAYTFQTLFGGGRAELELIQSEDVLESGIEIVAQPPGTKLKSITLLSGGQKTLTAVALLFALYMVKPSPFCLLDELDAPLDESNIGRFVDLLKKFVKESQFIIITHNKRTVAAADAIYGVTMEERGISKTVSMRFNQEHGEAEAHRTIADSVASAAALPNPA